MIGLASLGISLISDLISDHGEDMVKQGIEKVTGINLDKKPSEAEKRIIEENMAFVKQEVELMYADKQSAREMAMTVSTNAKDWLVRNTGSMIGLSVIGLSFTLFYMLLSGGLSIENSNVAMIVGFAGGYVSQVLSFYFGSSKESADKARG